MSELKLTNEGAPAFVKPDAPAWADALPIEKNSQDIYNHLKGNPDSTPTLAELSTLFGMGYMSVYWASRRLVLGGFAGKVEVKLPVPTKRNPDKTEIHIGLKFIPPWMPKGKKPKW